jgi:hypothetical protein
LLHDIFTVSIAFEKHQTKIQHPKLKSKIQPKPTVQSLEKRKQACPKKTTKTIPNAWKKTFLFLTEEDFFLFIP